MSGGLVGDLSEDWWVHPVYWVGPVGPLVGPHWSVVTGRSHRSVHVGSTVGSPRSTGRSTGRSIGRSTAGRPGRRLVGGDVGDW
jgi:hypothetical protein